MLGIWICNKMLGHSKMSSAETEAPKKVLEKEYDPPRIDKVRVEIDGQWG